MKRHQFTIQEIEETYAELNRLNTVKANARGVKRDVLGRAIDQKEGANIAGEMMVDVGLPHTEMGHWLKPHMQRDVVKFMAEVIRRPEQLELVVMATMGANFLSGLELGLLLARKYPEAPE